MQIMVEEIRILSWILYGFILMLKIEAACVCYCIFIELEFMYLI